MSLFERLFPFLSERRFNLFTGESYGIVHDSEKSIDSDFEDGLASPLQSEPLLSGGTLQTSRQIPGNSNGLAKWPLLIAVLLFMASLAFEIVMRMKMDSACLTLNEPWSK
jgi:hypothetical protein